MGRVAPLAPLVAEAARRLGVDRVALIDVGRPAGLNLVVDLARVDYSTGVSLGSPGSPVRITADVIRRAAPPSTALPTVERRIVLARSPLDLGSASERLLAVESSPIERREAALAQADLLAGHGVVRVPGDPVATLSSAVSSLPAGVTPIVTTTWAVSALAASRRAALLAAVASLARERRIAWVSVEGVGVAPSIPTFGDRPASGHSILGVAVSSGGQLRFDAVGRCWQRGAKVAWLGEDVR